MHRSLKQEGTQKGTLSGTAGQKGGMFGESTGPVDYIPSDSPPLQLDMFLFAEDFTALLSAKRFNTGM
jgi:hypothetical protein